MHTVLPRRLPEQVLKKKHFKVFASITFFFFFLNKAEKIDSVILEIIMPHVQASEALS